MRNLNHDSPNKGIEIMPHRGIAMYTGGGAMAPPKF